MAVAVAVVAGSDSAGAVRSVWGGTVAVGASCSARSRPNTLRSKLRMPMGEAFRVSWVREMSDLRELIPGQGGYVRLAAGSGPSVARPARVETDPQLIRNRSPNESCGHAVRA